MSRLILTSNRLRGVDWRGEGEASTEGVASLAASLARNSGLTDLHLRDNALDARTGRLQLYSDLHVAHPQNACADACAHKDNVHKHAFTSEAARKLRPRRPRHTTTPVTPK